MPAKIDVPSLYFLSSMNRLSRSHSFLGKANDSRLLIYQFNTYTYHILIMFTNGHPILGAIIYLNNRTL